LGGALLIIVLLALVRVLHGKWRASDIEFAKRLGSKDRAGSFGERVAGRLKGSSAVRAQLARDVQLTLRGFSSAVYTAAGLAGLWMVVLAAVLTTGILPEGGRPFGGGPSAAAAGEVVWFEATWLPPVLAVKVACVLAVVSLVSLVPVLVAHESAHLWLERAVGAKGAEVWRAKLWYARIVSAPAPLLAWAVGALSGEVEGFYLLPLLGETVWLWWLVSTLVGSLAFEMPEQPGLALVLMACVGLAVGGFVAFLWPTKTGGFGGKVPVGKVDDIVAGIRAGQGFFYAPNARAWITQYPVDAVPKAEGIYPESLLTGMRQGLIAQYQKCPHLGCRVPQCVSSQWFECGCHGSQYNRVGEKKGGPAPRGLDRFAMTVAGDSFTVDTGLIIQGPPIGVNTTGQEAEGPHCVSGGAGH
jgi:Rieske Fe-S protein